MQNQVPKVKSSFPFRPRLFEQQCGLYLQPLREKEYFKHYYTSSVQQLVSQQSVASANELLLCFLSCHVVMSSHVIIEKREIVAQRTSRN